MTKITENDIELYVIEELEAQGYQYIYGPDISPDAEVKTDGRPSRPERDSYEQVVLINRLQSAIQRLNPDLHLSAKEDAFKQVMRIGSPELLNDNEAFHKMLTEGVNVTYQKDLPASAGRAGGREQRGDFVKLIDFKSPENNEFLVINQFTIVDGIQGSGSARRNAPILFCLSMVCHWSLWN